MISTITGTLMWDLYQTEGDPIIANVIPRGAGNSPIYDMVLLQELAKILNENQNEPVQVRVTVEVLP